MSSLSSLELSSFRNIERAQLSLASAINLIWGENGSGKTSLLESIHLLATGKSFRTSLVDPMIMDSAPESVIFAKTEESTTIGLSKPRNQKHRLKLNNEAQKNWDEVARALPIQVLDSSSFQLLEGGPKARRRFMDWGVFHVKPQFVEQWRRSRKALANRNRLLKAQRFDEAQMQAWDRELSLAAAQIDEARKSYMDELLPIFEAVFHELCGALADDLSIAYKSGWEEGTDLYDQLQLNRSQDIKYGSSQIGPHRADIEIKQGRRKALELLSRGQQKLLVCSLKIAQGKLLSEVMDQQCIYLVDDLPAELDSENRGKVMTHLRGLGSQLFVTCVDRSALDLSGLEGLKVATFHVERGIIKD